MVKITALSADIFRRHTLLIYVALALAGCDGAPQRDSLDARGQSGHAAIPGRADNAGKVVAGQTAAVAMKALPDAKQLALAYQAVFGRNGSVSQTEDDIRFERESGKIIWFNDQAILVVPGSHAEPSPVTTGALGLFYLRPNEGEFVLVRRLPNAVSGGIMGSPPIWEVTNAIADHPVIVSTTGGVWQGVYCATTTLTGLSKSGPIELVSFRSAFDNSGGQSDGGFNSTMKGAIANVRRNTSFDVEYRGTRNFTHSYENNAGTYERQSGDTTDELPEC